MQLVKDPTEESVSDAESAASTDGPLPFRPLRDYVLLKEIPFDGKTEGGVYVAGTAATFETRGRILAIGPGFMLQDGTRMPSELEVGQVVTLNPQQCLQLNDFGRDKYLLVREAYIYAECTRMR